MKTRSLIMFISVIVFMSCRSDRYEIGADFMNVDTISFDITNGLTIARDDVFGKVFAIKLETKKDNLLGRVDQILFGDSTIIVVDKQIAKSVLLFDFKGRFVGRVSRVGNGPAEYVGIKHVSRTQDGKIALFDELKQRIMLFEERGKFLECFDTDLFANSFEYMDSANIVFDLSGRYYPGNKPYDIYSFVVKNKQMKNKYMFGPAYFGSDFHLVRNFNLYKYDDKIYCNVNFMDVIFEMNVNEVKAKYALKLKPHSAVDFDFNTQKEFETIRRNYSFFDGDFIELKDYSFIHYRGHTLETILDLIYSHKTNETISIADYFNDPLFCFFSNPIARYDDNTLVCCSDGADVMRFKDNLFDVVGATDELVELYKDVTVDSNPILFFYEVKDVK